MKKLLYIALVALSLAEWRHARIWVSAWMWTRRMSIPTGMATAILAIPTGILRYGITAQSIIQFPVRR